jgi:cytochrome oxidase Cu insertion factor (SCO1/SenC/PrrC family)
MNPMLLVRTVAWAAVAAFVVLLGAVAIGSLLAPSGGGENQQAAIGGPFEMTDETGARVTQADLEGQPSLIFFGFTYCPDVCPTSLLLMETAVEKLGPDAAKKVNLVFITVDPERDTPELLKGYVPNFGPGIIGLTGLSRLLSEGARKGRVALPDGPFLDRLPARPQWPVRHPLHPRREGRNDIQGSGAPSLSH